MNNNNYKNQELIEIARKFIQEAEIDARRNPTSDKLKIVVVEPDEKPYELIIDNELKAFNKIVGGYIEIVPIGRTKKGAKVAIHLNEEGKLHEMPFNRNLVGFDVLVGTFFITAFNLEGDYISLTNEEVEKYIRTFTPIEIYL
jgi:Domain of unknown function (DUF3846)